MDESMDNGNQASQMASVPIAIDWTSFPIWCCGKYFPIEEIPQHTQENHTKHVDKSPGIDGNVKMATDNSSGIEINPPQFKTNTSDGRINNNSIVRYEEGEISSGRKKSDKNRADEKYYCEECDYTTKQKYKLKTHVDTKHLGIRYECEVCQVSYTARYSLNRHKKSKHESLLVHDHETLTTTPNFSQTQNEDVAKINREIEAAQRYALNRHKRNKHESLHALETLTTTPNFSQTQNEDAEINREIETAHLVATLPRPENQSVIGEIKREIITPPPSPQSQMDDSETKQQIETNFANHKDKVPSENENGEAPSRNDNVHSENHKDDVPSERNPNVPSAKNDNEAVIAYSEIKEEEVDMENLEVPGWRIFPEFENPPLKEKKEGKAGSTEEDQALGLEEQERIVKLHAKLEKEEKQRKKWDNKWWKRRAEMQKLQEVKDRDNGKDVKKEEEEIELFWPNEDVITDIVMVDDTREDNKEAKDDTVQNTEGVENVIQVVQDDLGQGTEECGKEQNSVVIKDSVGVVQDNDAGGYNVGQDSS